MKNWLIGILVAVVVVIGGLQFGWFGSAGDEDSTSGGMDSDREKTGVVEKRDIRLNVTVAGEIGPAERVSVRPEVNGRISKLPVDIGDKVKEGDLLFALDDTDLRIEIESRQTDIEAAQLQLEKARRDYERDRRLYEAALVSEEVFDDTKTQYELAKNTIERVQKELALAEDRLSKTQITAPFDCTILTRPVSAGQAVSGSGGFNSGTEVLTIANLNEMIINAHVNQVDVTRLEQGMKVQVQVEAVPGLDVGGVVERIAPQATIVNGTKGFAARIRLQDVDPRIQPGMTANISIPVTSAESVLAVPLAAVFTEFNPELQRQERYVYVQQKGNKFKKQNVQIGIADYFHVEIQKGLREGEVVSLEQPPKDRILPPESVSVGPEQVARTANEDT